MSEQPKPCSCDKGQRKTGEDKRFDIAVDRILNSGTLHPYMEDFWRFVDGKISKAKFEGRMPA